jgi:hypothetical protein
VSLAGASEYKSGAKGAWEGGLIIRGPVLRGPRSPIPLLRERMLGRERPADNRSRNCGTPQGAAPLAGGQVPSNGRWEPSRSEAARWTSEASPGGAAQLAGRQVPSNGSWDKGTESNGGSPTAQQPNSPTVQQSNSPTEGGVDGRPVSWFPVLNRILLLFWLLKTNPVTE